MVAVICGASTLKVAVPGASVTSPFNIRLLIPAKMMWPSAETAFENARVPLARSRAPLPRLRLPVPRGPAVTGRPVELPAISNPLSPATRTPPANVFEPLSCKIPPPVTLSCPAFWIVPLIVSVGAQGATCWPSTVIGATLIV